MRNTKPFSLEFFKKTYPTLQYDQKIHLLTQLDLYLKESTSVDYQAIAQQIAHRDISFDILDFLDACRHNYLDAALALMKTNEIDFTYSDSDEVDLSQIIEMLGVAANADLTAYNPVIEALIQYLRSYLSQTNQNSFHTYDGPPFATGNPHHGHLLVSAAKDLVYRYEASKGRAHEKQRQGYDCHGFPVKQFIEKYISERIEIIKLASVSSAGIKQLSQDIIAVVDTLIKDALRLEPNLSAENFVKELADEQYTQLCQQLIRQKINTWGDFLARSGREVHPEPITTMDLDYMETIWSVFKILYNDGHVISGKRVLPCSPGLEGSTVSNTEAREKSPIKKQTQAFTLKLQLQEEASEKPRCILVWNNQPWYLLDQTGVAVNNTLKYVSVDTQTELYIVAADCIERIFPEIDNSWKVAEFDINSIIGLTYQPLFQSTESYCIHNANFVDAETGTGIVSLSPAHDETAYALHVEKPSELALIDGYDEQCCVSQSETHDKLGLTGCAFYDDAIATQLQAFFGKTDVLLKSEPSEASLEVCPRTDTPLFYRARSSWFIDVMPQQKRLQNVADSVSWKNPVAKQQIDERLADLKNWDICRKLAFGTPIPIWVNIEEPTDIIIIGSKQELAEFLGEDVQDLHPGKIDQHEINKAGATYKRIEFVFDCWFESACMPYASCLRQFPELKNVPLNELPVELFQADLIVEGIDQTRGWFYNLLVISTLLFDQPIFKNVLALAHVMGNDGKKMSKSKQNYEPLSQQENLDEHRVYMCKQIAPDCRPILTGTEHKQSSEYLFHDMQAFVKFVETYEHLGNFSRTEIAKLTPQKLAKFSTLHHWWLCELHSQIIKLDAHFNFRSEHFNLSLGYQILEDLVDTLKNKYLNSAKILFDKNYNGDEAYAATCVTYYSVKLLIQLASFIRPHGAQELWNTLGCEGYVSEQLFPQDYLEISAEKETHNAFRTVEIFLTNARSMRTKVKINQSTTIYSVTFPQAYQAELEKYPELIKAVFKVIEIKFSPNQEYRVVYSLPKRADAIKERVLTDIRVKYKSISENDIKEKAANKLIWSTITKQIQLKNLTLAETEDSMIQIKGTMKPSKTKLGDEAMADLDAYFKESSCPLAKELFECTSCLVLETKEQDTHRFPTTDAKSYVELCCGYAEPEVKAANELVLIHQQISKVRSKSTEQEQMNPKQPVFIYAAKPLCMLDIKLSPYPYQLIECDHLPTDCPGMTFVIEYDHKQFEIFVSRENREQNAPEATTALGIFGQSNEQKTDKKELKRSNTI